jgi:hypothetical protein
MHDYFYNLYRGNITISTNFLRKILFWKFYQEKEIFLKKLQFFLEKFLWNKISWENFHTTMDIPVFLGCRPSQVKTEQIKIVVAVKEIECSLTCQAYGFW